ncbi:MAG: hypothetical protein D6B28_08375 [Gammaproteobacteria bacterium]|nr:MAG: hypothetical protein D6B28_08375 [Gammaproteobacteria bacterium]
MPKKICNYKQKEIEKKIDQLTTIVAKPKYICKKCARVACNKNLLCKPEKINFKKSKLHKRDDVCAVGS